MDVSSCSGRILRIYAGILSALSACLMGVPAVANGADDIFLDSKHAVSGRFAVLEEMGGTAWLYLTHPELPKPEKDAIVYTRNKLASMEEVQAEARRGQPPPLAKEYASEGAIIPYARLDEFNIKWSFDGQSVAVLRNNVPLTMILADANRGYSKALSKSGPFGEPWDQQIYERVFGK